MKQLPCVASDYLACVLAFLVLFFRKQLITFLSLSVLLPPLLPAAPYSPRVTVTPLYNSSGALLDIKSQATERVC